MQFVPFQSESACVSVCEKPFPPPPPPPPQASAAHSNDAAGAAGVASADQGNGVVEGHGRVRGAELVRVVVRGRGRRKRGLRAVALSDAHGGGHGRLDELVGRRSLAEEGLHPPSAALVHDDHLDDLLALDEGFWAEVPGLDGAEQGGWGSQGQRHGLIAGLAQLIGLQPVVN